VEPFIALTDPNWFGFLSTQSSDGVVDEVNFWSPESILPLKNMSPGTPVFLRLRTHNAIAGFGFYAHFRVLDLDMAWELFGWKNGDPDEANFLRRMGSFRGLDLLDPQAPRAPLGCTILRSATFWPRNQWIKWEESMGWQKPIVRGKTELDATRAQLLLSTLTSAAPPELSDDLFVPLDVDEREIAIRAQVRREGQGTFRTRLLDAYEGSCAITGEHTEPVLDAAHIQPYLGPRSNHLQNGLTLTKEFHKLFDLGYVTITPEYVIRVSPRLHSHWKNGKRYYLYNEKPLLQIPSRKDDRPSQKALVWHNEHKFLK
jgi:putative restriction endonuclease